MLGVHIFNLVSNQWDGCLEDSICRRAKAPIQQDIHHWQKVLYAPSAWGLCLTGAHLSVRQRFHALGIWDTFSYHCHLADYQREYNGNGKRPKGKPMHQTGGHSTVYWCIGYPFPAPGTIHHQPPFNSHSVASISLVVRKEIWMVGINRQEDKSLFKFNKNEALTSSINSLSSC